MGSTGFNYNSLCPPELSPKNDYVAYVSGSSLIIRNTSSLAVKRLFPLTGYTSPVRWIRWTEHPHDEERFLVASSKEAQIFVIDGVEDKPIGKVFPPNGIRGIQWVSFQGRNVIFNRIAVISEEPSDLTIWSSDGLDTQIFDFKFECVFGQSSNALSVLTRRGTVDSIETISIADDRLTKSRSIPLKSVIDAHTVVWSPNKDCFAVVDNFVVDYSVSIWHSGGQCLRTFKGPNISNGELRGLGARSICWLEKIDAKLILVIGGCDNLIVVYDVMKDICEAVLNHGIIDKTTPVWEEHMTTELKSIYRKVSWPFNSAIVENEKSDFIPGISIMTAYSGCPVTLIATVSENTPNLVRIWACKNLKITSHAVICQSLPITRLEWLPERGKLLIFSSGGSTFGVWDLKTSIPVCYEWLGLDEDLVDVRWAENCDENHPRVFGRSSRQFSLLTIEDQKQEHDSVIREDDTNVINILRSVDHNEKYEYPSAVENTFLRS